MTPFFHWPDFQFASPADLDPRAVSLDLRLNPGGLLLIEGANGSGKTTLARSIARRILTETDLTVAMVPQIGNVGFVLPLNLRDVVAFAGEQAADDKDRPVTLLSADALDRPWNSASGGERQKALLTRAFLSQSQILILDEPFNHLDSDSRDLVGRWLERALTQGRGIILVAHDGPHIGAADLTRIVLRSR